jgi:2-dehydro-3-deoxyglucarate aldolase
MRGPTVGDDKNPALGPPAAALPAAFSPSPRSRGYAQISCGTTDHDARRDRRNRYDRHDRHERRCRRTPSDLLGDRPALRDRVRGVSLVRSENGFRRALERGETVVGAAASTFSPAVVETMGYLGLDYVWLDFEHAGPSPYDSTALEELTRAAEVADTELLVRLPAPDPPLVRKVLDAGVRTILLPRIETAAELRRGVAAAHFAYDEAAGDRGVGVGRSAEWKGYADEHVAGEDDEVLVGTMVENRRAVANLEELLAVPDLGFAFLGPADLSVSLADGDASADPDELQDAIDRTLDACLDADVPLGRIRNDPEAARAAADAGYRILRIGDDLGAVRATLGERLDAVEK